MVFFCTTKNRSELCPLSFGMIFVPRNLVSCFSQYFLSDSDSCAGWLALQRRATARAGMSRGNGKERMDPEEEGAGEVSPAKRLLKCATVANPLLQNPSAVQCTISTCLCCLEFGDQIWNAFILLTRCTGSALLFTGFRPMGHQPAVNPPEQSPVQGCPTTIQYTQSQVSPSLAGNIVGIVNKIRREDAFHRRGDETAGAGQRGKSLLPRTLTLGHDAANVQELLRNFRSTLAETARAQAKIKQSYDDYVKNIGELDTCLSKAVLRSHLWSGVGIVLVQLSQYSETAPQQVFVMGGRQQLAVQQVHTLTICVCMCMCVCLCVYVCMCVCTHI